MRTNNLPPLTYQVANTRTPISKNKTKPEQHNNLTFTKSPHPSFPRHTHTNTSTCPPPPPPPPPPTTNPPPASKAPAPHPPPTTAVMLPRMTLPPPHLLIPLLPLLLLLLRQLLLVRVKVKVVRNHLTLKRELARRRSRTMGGIGMFRVV